MEEKSLKEKILMRKGQHFLCYVKFHYRADSHLFSTFMLVLMHPNCSNYDFILKQPFFKTMIIATHNHFMSKRRDCKGNNSVLPLGKYKRTKYILINVLPFRMDFRLKKSVHALRNESLCLLKLTCLIYHALNL